MSQQRFDYHPCYCEENVWRLCQDPRFDELDVRVVFVSNELRTCVFWNQRAASDPTHPVVWDYHVVLLVDDDGLKVWDLDCTAGCPLTLGAWLDASFPYAGQLDPMYEPRFRLVARDEFLSVFASDRSHMRKAGGWLQPPPSWTPISPPGHSNLFDFVDMQVDFVGEVLDLDQLRQRAA